MQENHENGEKKEIKARSRLYPRYDLEESIRFIEAVSRLGGNRVSTQAVAAELKKAVNNSTFIGRISSSKQFGLLIQESGKKLSLSPLGKEIMFPLGDAEKKIAIRKAFSTPPFYGELIEGFKGKVIPEITALSNRLVHDYSIEAAAKEVAARNFIRSAEYAGLIQNGILVITDDDTLQPAISGESLGSGDMARRVLPPARDLTATEKQFIFDFSGGIKLIIPRNERTSEAIADGELKNARKALSEFGSRFVEPEELNQTEKSKDESDVN